MRELAQRCAVGLHPDSIDHRIGASADRQLAERGSNVVVFGGVGNLWGTLIGGTSMGIVNKLLEPYAGAVLAKIVVLVALIFFIQRRPRGLFPQTGRAAESA